MRAIWSDRQNCSRNVSQMGNIPVTATTKIFPKALRYKSFNKWEAYCNTHRRRTAIQMGGVLKYLPFLRAQWHRKRCNTNWRRPNGASMRAIWSDRQNCSYNVSQKLNVSGAFLKSSFPSCAKTVFFGNGGKSKKSVMVWKTARGQRRKSSWAELLQGQKIRDSPTLRVVLPHLLGEIFRAIFSLFFVDFSLILSEALVNYQSISINFSQF